MHRRFFLAILFATIFFSPCLAFSASPVVYFSDLTDGPVSGWNGSSSKGAAVSIWGNNFGSSRGSSYVTIGGVNLTNNSDYAEWGATTNPTTARGLQRITFWLNSNMTLGNTTISVTTPEGTSDSIPFYTRNTGNIYFVSPSGNDSHTGRNDTNQMWATFYKVRTTVQAGDVVYFRNGLWTAVEQGAGNSSAILKLYDLGSMPAYGFNDGQNHNSIALVSYPGEVARIGRGLESDANIFVRRYDDSGRDGLNYWTFSKFQINTYDFNFDWNGSVSANKDKSLRIVGNDMTSVIDSPTRGHLINIFSNATDMVIYGNFMHGAGKKKDSDPHTTKTKAIYFCGGGVSDGVDVGWNEIYRCNGHSQFYGHFRSDRLSNLHFHDNFVHEQGQQIIVFGGGDPTSDPKYHFLGEGIKIYNNIFANNLGHIRFSNGANGLGGSFEVYNNTFYNNTQSFGHSELILTQYQDAFNFHHNIVVQGPDSTKPQYWYNRPAGYDSAPHSNNETGNHNLWYGSGNGPSWDTNSFENVSPQFIVDRPVSYFDFRLKESSPIIVAGQKIGVQFEAVPQNDQGGGATISAPRGFSLVTK